MSFLSRLFKRLGAAVKPAKPEQSADNNVPTRSGNDTLTEIRHQARTGNPAVSGKHRSGSF